MHGLPMALLHLGGLRSAAAGCVFLAVDGAHMRWIEGEIRSSDPELLAVRIHPFPEGFGRSPALRPICAVDAHDVGCKPVAIAAAKAAAVIGSVAGRLQAACDRLTIVVAEG